MQRWDCRRRTLVFSSFIQLKVVDLCITDISRSNHRYSAFDMAVQHPTSSPVPEGIIDDSKEEDFDESLPPTTLPPMTPLTPKISKPTWFSSLQRKAQEREKQLRKQKLKRNNRLELVLKLFREVDGKFKHAANVSIEKRFGVDNRARFVCLKKDKLGVWRT